MTQRQPGTSTPFRWAAALVGQFLFVFAILALSGPGRIDIVDGQTRYEVARSLVEHGDSVIRDDRVDFGVFPGRNGQLYTLYRFPQSLIGAPAILAADLTGPTSEGRRHFFFTLTSAFCGAVLAVTYLVWFQQRGQSPWAAFFWSCAGIFCTPTWFYSTSTFDDVLGAAAVVAAVVVAFLARSSRPLLGATVAGLLMGFAFNCKQPLGIFTLVVLAASVDLQYPWRRQLLRGGLVVLGVVVGIAVYKAYDWHKYPEWGTEAHLELLSHYAPIWTEFPLAAIPCLTLSPGAGVIWYFPPLLITLYGLARWYRSEKWLVLALMASVLGFFLFLSALTFFKGDPSWGPRYLTPVFALLWLFAPEGVAGMSRGLVTTLLMLGFLVQVAGLTVDPHRLFFERKLSASFYLQDPWIYFHPLASHLMNRPREIVAILQASEERAEQFTPAPTATFAVPVLDAVLDRDPDPIRKYHVMNSFRPWWICQRYLPPDQRPVNLGQAALGLLGLAGAGLGMVALSLGRRQRSVVPQTEGALTGACR